MVLTWELLTWIDEGILLPVPESEKVSSLLPTMVIQQVRKNKLYPVLDFKQLNEHVSSHSGGSAICDDTIRRWRKVGTNLTLIDLRKAYLQLHVDSSLWKHQVVCFKGSNY